MQQTKAASSGRNLCFLVTCEMLFEFYRPQRSICVCKILSCRFLLDLFLLSSLQTFSKDEGHHMLFDVKELSDGTYLSKTTVRIYCFKVTYLIRTSTCTTLSIDHYATIYVSKRTTHSCAWQNLFVPYFLLARRIYQPWGRVWGGSSSLNAMVYVRGHAFFMILTDGRGKEHTAGPMQTACHTLGNHKYMSLVSWYAVPWMTRGNDLIHGTFTHYPFLVFVSWMPPILMWQPCDQGMMHFMFILSIFSLHLQVLMITVGVMAHSKFLVYRNPL